jgi:flagellar hook-associated protein 3 FlgL
VRVTSAGMGAQLNRDLQAALAALAKQHAIIASGRRLNAPSDDPTGTARALTVRSRQTANSQYLTNIAAARGNLSTSESTVRSAIDYLQQAKDLAIQGSNDSNSAAARQALGEQVNQILEAMVSFGNSRGANGGMLFGGQESNVPPYTVTLDVTNKITAVTVNPRGIDGTLPVEVAEGLTVAQGVSGTITFGTMADPTNAFDTLIRLRDALNANNGANVRAELDDLTVAHDRATTASILVGTRLALLETMENRLMDEAEGLASALSTLEDADMAKAITDLNAIQTLYEAGLASGARLLQQSLVDFLR